MMKFTFFLIAGVSGYQFLMPQVFSPIDLETVSCATKIVEKYDELRSIFVHSCNAIYVDYMARMASRTSVRVSNSDMDLTRMKIPKRSRFVLMIVDEVSDLWHYFLTLQRSPGFNSSARLFIIYAGDEDIENVFVAVMEFFVLQTVVMDKYNDIYVSEGFEKACGKSKAVLLGNCRLVKMRDIDKVFRYEMGSWQGCPVKALALRMPPYVIDVTNKEAPGFEVEIFRTVAEKLNFTIEYVEHNFTHWGNKVDGNYTMLGQFLYEKRGDVLFGMLNINDTYLGDFQGCVPYLDVDYAFYVPAAKITSPWKKIITVFWPDYWIAILISIITMSIIVHIFSKFKKEHFNQMNIFASLFTQSIALPKSHIVRHTFLLWCLLVFMIRASYECGLVSLLTKPTFEHQIDSVEGIIKSGLDVGGQSSMKELFSESRNIYNKKIYEKWIDCPLGICCVNITASKRTAAAFSNTRNVEYYMNEFLDEHGMSKIYQLPVHTKTYMWMLMRKGYPLIYQMNHLILYLRQSGLLTKFIKDLYHNHHQLITIHAKIPITLEHFYLPFTVYFLGLAFAAVAFILEIIIARKRRIIYMH